MQAISRVISTKFSPEAIEEAKNEKKGEKTVPSVSLDELPLGFNTGDKDVDRAATVLRLLYISDMKELQITINDIIVAVQNFTADPKVPPSFRFTQCVLTNKSLNYRLIRRWGKWASELMSTRTFLLHCRLLLCPVSRDQHPCCVFQEILKSKGRHGGKVVGREDRDSS